MSKKEDDVKPEPVKPMKLSGEALKSEIEAMLRVELRNVFETGSETVAKISQRLSGLLANAITKGDKAVSLELQDQIDGLAELGRIKTAQNAQRLLRGVLGVAVKAASLASGGVV